MGLNTVLLFWVIRVALPTLCCRTCSAGEGGVLPGSLCRSTLPSPAVVKVAVVLLVVILLYTYMFEAEMAT